MGAKAKLPYAIHMKDDEPFAFAGMWDAWKGWLQSYIIITTDANEVTAPVHNRMPMILKPGDYDRWLSRDPTERPPVDLLRPYDADGMIAHTVDPRVGDVRNNEPGLCKAWTCPPNSA